MEFKPKILSYCFLKRYKDYIGEFGRNSQKLSELLIKVVRTRFKTVLEIPNTGMRTS